MYNTILIFSLFLTHLLHVQASLFAEVLSYIKLLYIFIVFFVI